MGQLPIWSEADKLSDKVFWPTREFCKSVPRNIGCLQYLDCVLVNFKSFYWDDVRCFLIWRFSGLAPVVCPREPS